MTLESITQDWLIYLRSNQALSKHTLVAYESDLQEFFNFLKDHMAKQISIHDVNTLEIADIRGWLSHRNLKDYHPRSTARALSALKNFAQYLISKEIIKTHCISRFKPPRVKKTLPRPLSQQQTSDLLNAILELTTEPWVAYRDLALFTLIYSVGLRISEALNLNWENVNTGNYITIHGKRNKFRQVPLLDMVRTALKAYRSRIPFPTTTESPIFLGVRGGRLSTSVADFQMRTYRQFLGFPESATPHALRHSCATHLMESSGNLRAIQELLGHASLSTTQIYTEINQKQLMKVYAASHPRSSRKIKP